MASILGYVIPFAPRPQRMIIQLGTATYNLRTRWSDTSNCWLLDIGDVDNNPILGGIPMITGADLLEQYRYLGFVGSLFAYTTDGPPDMVPTLTGLGITAQVAYIPDTPP